VREQEHVRYFVFCTLASGYSSFDLVIVERFEKDKKWIIIFFDDKLCLLGFEYLCARFLGKFSFSFFLCGILLSQS